MKIKIYSAKILALLVTMVMAMSLMCVPAMAALGTPVDYTLSNSLVDSGVYSIGTINDVTGNDITLADFKTALSATENSNNIGLCNFENTNIARPAKNNSSKWVNIINMKFGENSDKTLTVTHSSVFDSTSSTAWRHQGFYVVGSDDGQVNMTSGTTAVTLPCSGETDGKHYYYDFSAVSGGSDSEVLKTVGLSVVGYVGEISLIARYKSLDGEYTHSKTISASKTDEATEKQYSFFGFTAPEGMYIYQLEIIPPTSEWPTIDDMCFITQDAKINEHIPTTVEISGIETIEQPPYGAISESAYTVMSKNAYGNALVYDDVTLSLSETNTGVSLNQEKGVLSVTRDFDTSKTIDLVAKSGINSELSDELVVSVSKVDPYYRADRIVSSHTEYTRNDFVKDLDNSKHIAVLNFDVGSYALTTDGATVSVSGNGGTIDINNSYKQGSSNKKSFPVNTAVYADDKYIDKKTSGVYGTSLWKYNYNITFNTENAGELLPTAFGFAASSGRYSCKLMYRITYSNGSMDDIMTNEAPVIILNTDGHSQFFGFKAPLGQYITKVELYSDSTVNVDDLCVILEDPTDLAPRFSSDAAGLKGIYKLGDIANSGNLYVTVPAQKTAGKVILAVYGTNNELIAVNSADISTTDASYATVALTSDARTKVKAFVWDSLTGLNPIGNSGTIDK